MKISKFLIIILIVLYSIWYSTLLASEGAQSVRGAANTFLELSIGGAASYAEFSPDGAKLVTQCAYIDRATVWATKVCVTNGKKLYDLIHGSNRVMRKAAFSPNGAQIVTASDDGTAKVWDSEDGKLLYTLTHANRVYDAAFSPDGKKIITGSSDCTAKIWNSNTGGEILSIACNSTVFNVSFDPSSQNALIVEYNRAAKIYNVETGELLHSFEPEEGVSFAKFSSDGSRILAAGLDSSVYVWNADNGELIRRLIYESPVMSASFCPVESDNIVTGHARGIAVLKNAAFSNRQLYLERDSADYPSGIVKSVGFDVKERLAFAVSKCGKIRLCDAETGKLLKTFYHYSIEYGALSPDGCRMVTASNDGTVRVWKIAETLLAQRFQPNDPQLDRRALSALVKSLLTNSRKLTTRQEQVIGTILRRDIPYNVLNALREQYAGIDKILSNTGQEPVIKPILTREIPSSKSFWQKFFMSAEYTKFLENLSLIFMIS